MGLNSFRGAPVEVVNLTGQTISANGDTGEFDLSEIVEGFLAVFANALSGTATPTLNVFFDQRITGGTWITVATLTPLTAAPNYSFANLGNAASGYVLASKGRVRWTVSGTNPSFTGVTVALTGRRR